MMFDRPNTKLRRDFAQYLDSLEMTSKEVSKETVRLARSVWNMLSLAIPTLPPPHSGPGVDGKFVFDWDNASILYEIEFIPLSDGQHSVDWFQRDRATNHFVGGSLTLSSRGSASTERTLSVFIYENSARLRLLYPKVTP